MPRSNLYKKIERYGLTRESGMTEQPRDWDKELADIDRVIGKQGTPPPGGAPVAAPARRHAVAHSANACRRRVRDRAGSVAMTWFWVGLAVLLAAALPLWPYEKTCGLQLFFYLGAAAARLSRGRDRRRPQLAHSTRSRPPDRLDRRHPRRCHGCTRGAAADRLRGPGGDLVLPLGAGARAGGYTCTRTLMTETFHPHLHGQDLQELHRR